MGAGSGDKEDFTAYVDARRASLVQGVAALGSPPRHAAALTDRALALARRDWRELRQRPDPGVEVWRLLLEVRAQDTTPWWREEPAVGSPRLDRLTPERRTCLVLSAVAGLDDADVVSLSGEWPRPGDPDAAALETEARELAAAVDVAPRDARAVAGGGRWPRARRGTLPVVRPVVLVVVLALVVGVGSWWRDRAPEAADRRPDVLGSAPVRTVENDVPAPWWASGELVLGDSAVRLRSVRRLARVDGSVVYSDAEGKVVFVDATGFRLPLGRSEPGAALVSDQERGWVAWRDVDSGELVVADANTGEELARRELETGVPDPDGPPVEARPLAIEGPTVHYVDGSGSHSWDPLVEPTGSGREQDQEEGPAGLLDVDGLTSVVQVGGRTIWFDGPFGPPVERRGVGAQLSPGGGYVLTRVGSDRYSPIRVYDTVNGTRRPTGIQPGEIVVDAVFSTTGAITLVVGEAQQVSGVEEFRRLSQARGWRLRTCFIGSGSCTDHLRVSSADGEPVLAP